MRCGYGRPRLKNSLLALRSTSACKTGRNVPLSVVDEKCLDLIHPDVPADRRDAKGFSPVTDVPPTADEPVGHGSPPQHSTAPTLFARNCDTLIPEGTRSGGPEEDTDLASPTLLTTPFFVDALKSASAQAKKDSPTLSRQTGQEPLLLLAITVMIREPQQRPSQANASPYWALNMAPQQDK